MNKITFPARYTAELLKAIEAIEPLNTQSWLGITTEEDVIQMYLDREVANQRDIDPLFTQAMLIDDLRDLASNLDIAQYTRASRQETKEINRWWITECDPAGGYGLSSHV